MWIREIDADFQYLYRAIGSFRPCEVTQTVMSITPHEKGHAHQLVNRQILIHGPDARRRCIAGIAKRRWLTFDMIVPLVGSCTPDRILIRVDFPAPLSPKSAALRPHEPQGRHRLGL